MSNQIMIKRCLNIIANNYNKNKDWIEGSMELWFLGTKEYTDLELYNATIELCQTDIQFPKLSDVITIMNHQRTKRARNKEYSYCKECEHHHGLVHVYILYWLDENDKGDRSKQYYECTCKCTCFDSYSQYQALLSFDDLLKQWNKKAGIEIIQVLKTDSVNYWYPLQQRNPMEYSKQQKRLENKGINPFMKIVEGFFK